MRRATASSCASGGNCFRAPGVPWNHRTGSPSGSPNSAYPRQPPRGTSHTASWNGWIGSGNDAVLRRTLPPLLSAVKGTRRDGPVPAPSGRRVEPQRARVDAEPLAGGLRTVVEHVPEVSSALLAGHLDAVHEVAEVVVELDRVAVERLPEARPSRPGVELGGRAEQL